MNRITKVLLSVLAVGIAQLLLKYGMNKLGPLSFSSDNLLQTAASLFTSPAILIGAVLFGASSLLWLLAISETELSYAYPILGLGYAFVAFFSWILFNETLSAVRWIGIITITAGIIVMSRSGE